MFGIGPQELVVILVIGLLVLGPKRLPEIARSLGKGLAEFRRASSDLRQSIALEDAPSRPAPPPRPPAQTAQTELPLTTDDEASDDEGTASRHADGHEDAGDPAEGRTIHRDGPMGSVPAASGAPAAPATDGDSEK